jgi:hypothetical protein
MTATFAFDQDYGAATGSPAHGTSNTTGIGNMNWANSSDPTQTYSNNPITAGNNSFDIWPYGHFSGSYNQIGPSIYFNHITTSFGTGITLKATHTSTYTTPSASANANLVTDITAPGAITSGLSINVGPTNPQTAGKTASTTNNPAYTEYLPTQLQTTSSAAPGDTATVSLELEYLEN